MISILTDLTVVKVITIMQVTVYCYWWVVGAPAQYDVEHCSSPSCCEGQVPQLGHNLINFTQPDILFLLPTRQGSQV